MEPILYILLGAGLTAAGTLAWARLAGFLSQSPADFAGKAPRFDIRERLRGPIACEGVVYGPVGRVVSRFVAEMQVDWTGDTGRMTEDFHYDDGSTQHRFWDLSVAEDGTIRAAAPDIVGEASGRQEGAGVVLRYRLRLPDSAGGYVLDATDWMYLMENGTIMNHSQFRKFGFKVAELVATMRPAIAEAADASEVTEADETGAGSSMAAE